MNKVFLIVLPFIIILIFAGFFLKDKFGTQVLPNQSAQVETVNTIYPTMIPTEKPTDFTARFEIYTLGTKRIFTAAMYHNQSSGVFIQNPDPSVIYIKKSGISWDDFFKTLPFSLTRDCLVTGTKQTFCTSDSKKLMFFLNNIENPDALVLEIKPGDYLQVRYE